MDDKLLVKNPHCKSINTPPTQWEAEEKTERSINTGNSLGAMCRLGRLDSWPSHCRSSHLISDVDGRRGYCWLVRIIFSDYLSGSNYRQLQNLLDHLCSWAQKGLDILRPSPLTITL